MTAMPKINALVSSTIPIVIILLLYTFLPFSIGASEEDGVQSFTQVEYISGASGGDLSTTGKLSPGQTDRIRKGHLERRENVVVRSDNNPAARLSGGPTEPGRPSEVVPSHAGAGPPGDPSAFLIGKNVKNPLASIIGSSIAEPAAANDRGQILYLGNTFASQSVNGGTTWRNVPLPLGPEDAPYACCDPDVIHDHRRGGTFWSVLYLDEGLSNGAVRIFVRRNIPAGDACSYTVDPGGTGNDIIPDYPHLGLSENFLYLSTANLQQGAWVGSQVRRFKIDDMLACNDIVRTEVFTFGPEDAPGQRVFVPIEGAKDAMYWGALESSTMFRIFQWPEDSASVSQFLRPISESTFENPDCRGGVDDIDFIESRSAWSIAGFRLRGAQGRGGIYFLWNVGPDILHTQGHVHAAIFGGPGLAPIAEPHIFNNNFCFGYPAVGSNDRGDLGMSIAAGGRTGGGGMAARGFVSISDDFVPGIGIFDTFKLTADGTHNPLEARFGDYFTVRRQSPCGLFWAATNYSLLNGNFEVSNVNARYVEFGRGRDSQCYVSGNQNRGLE